MNTPTVFAALGDQHRLWLLNRLAADGRTATGALAAELPITRQAVAKHLKVLEHAGLIHTVTSGREKLHDVRPEGLAPAADWLDDARNAWRRRLFDLKERAENQISAGSDTAGTSSSHARSATPSGSGTDPVS